MLPKQKIASKRYLRGGEIIFFLLEVQNARAQLCPQIVNLASGNPAKHLCLSFLLAANLGSAQSFATELIGGLTPQFAE